MTGKCVVSFNLKQLTQTSQQESKNTSKKTLKSHFSEVFMHKSALQNNDLPNIYLKNDYEMAFALKIWVKEKEKNHLFVSELARIPHQAAADARSRMFRLSFLTDTLFSSASRSEIAEDALLSSSLALPWCHPPFLSHPLYCILPLTFIV